MVAVVVSMPLPLRFAMVEVVMALDTDSHWDHDKIMKMMAMMLAVLKVMQMLGCCCCSK